MTGPATDIPSQAHRRCEAVAIALTLAGLAVSIAFGLASDGYYMDDDLTHYRFAADGWSDVNALLHRWARPGFNLPMALAARIGGMAACRILSALMTAGAAYLGWRIARRIIGPCIWAALVPLMLWTQPMVFKLSLTMLTETPALLYLTAGVWLYLRGNRIAGCGVVSILFVTRDETMALAPLMAAAVLYDAWREQTTTPVRGGAPTPVRGGAPALPRSSEEHVTQQTLHTAPDWKECLQGVFSTWWVWACAGATIWAVAAYWLAAWWFELPPDASPLTIFGKQYSMEYGSGTWLHYVGMWPDAAGLGVLILAVGGAVWLGRRAWLVSAWTFGLVALHTVIFARGMFASGGYSRFIIPIGGLLAVLAAGGLKAVVAERSRRIAVIVLASGAVWLPITAWTVLTQWNWDLREKLLPLARGFAVVAALVLVGPILRRWRYIEIVAAFIERRILRTRLSVVVALVVALAAVGAQLPRLLPELRPLRLTDWPMYRVLLAARDDVAATNYAGNVGYTQHVLLQYHRPNTRPAYSNAHAIEVWRAAEPGTLYFWESQYSNKPHEPQSTQLLKSELDRLGKCIVDEWDDTPYEFLTRPHVMVYVRTAEPEASTAASR